MYAVKKVNVGMNVEQESQNALPTGKVILSGKPNGSLIVILLIAPVLILKGLTGAFPQIADILRISWVTETTSIMWWAISWLVFCILYWAFIHELVILDELLNLLNEQLSLEDLTKKLKSIFEKAYIVRIPYFFLTLLTIVPRWKTLRGKLEKGVGSASSEQIAKMPAPKIRLKTVLTLAVSGFAFATVGISIGAECFANKPESYPVLTLFLLLISTAYACAMCRLMILAIQHRIYWLSVVATLPILLVYIGMFATWPSAEIWVFSSVTMLVWLPIGGINRLFNKGKTNWWSRGPTIIFVCAIMFSWNFYDATDYPNTDLTERVPKGMINTKFSLKNMQTALSGQLPPVFLNMGGGGSRAAIFDALILNKLWAFKVKKSDITKPNNDLMDRINALPTDVENVCTDSNYVYPGRLLLIGTRFISSVSGGSLASAHWTNGTLKALSQANAVTSIEQRALALKQFFAHSAELDENASDKDYFAKCEKDPFVKAMRQNYLAATIVGLYKMDLSRSTAIRDAFARYALNDGDDASDHPLTHLSDLYLSETQGVLPCSMFNATLTTSGERLVLSNMESDLFQDINWFGPTSTYNVVPPVESAAEERHLRFRVRPAHIKLHHDIDNGWDPPLTTAIWVSSDFPYGFQVNRIRVTAQGKEQDYGSLDGGLSDNLGLNTTMSLIRNCIKNPSNNPENMRPLLNHFFVFDIDTSELPIDPAPPNAFGYHWQEANNAIRRANQVSEQTTWALYLTELESKWGDSLPDSTTVSGMGAANIGFCAEKWAWYRVRCAEFADEHVFTSWHLNEQERQKLYTTSRSQLVNDTIRKASLSYLALLPSKSNKSPVNIH